MGGPLEGFDPAAGLEVPKGDPDGLNGAARQFSGAAEGLTTHENTIQRATHAPSWQGGAADAYVSLNTITVGYANQASDAMSRGASAAKSLATALRAAQEQARAAIAKLEGMRATAAGISGAYDSAMALPAEDRGSQLKMLGMAVADFHSGVASLRAEVADAHQRAEEAAERAAQAFGEVADMAPSVVASRTRRIIDRVAAGDYSSLEGVDMDYLSVAAQRAIASYAAGDVQSNLAAGEGLDELRPLSAMVGRYQHDDEFAAAFFNRMGGADAGMMHWNAGFWYFEGKGHDNEDLMNLMAPFAMLMGTATRSGDLEEEFTDDFLGRQYEMRDRLLYHNAMEHFIRAGSASNYDGTFLAEVGQELLIDAGADSVAHDPSEELLSFISGNPEASGRLLNGNSAQGLSNLYSLMSNYHWTDDGAALGAVIEAGAHDLRYYDLDLANQVAHKVILITPEFSILPDGVKPALVTIADDHIVAFEYAAMGAVEPGVMDRPANEIGLGYEEGETYLAMLFRDEATREGVTNVVSEQVSDNIYTAASHDAGRSDASDFALERMQRAGALQEMGSLSAYRGLEDAAESRDQANKYAQFFAGEVKSLMLAKVDKIPGVGTPIDSFISGQVLEKVFPTDHQITAVRDGDIADVNLEQELENTLLIARVGAGDLPPETLRAIQEDGTLDFNLNDRNGTSDVDVAAWFDTDGDGRLDVMTELDLQNNLSRRNGAYTDISTRAMTDLRDGVLPSN